MSEVTLHQRMVSFMLRNPRKAGGVNKLCDCGAVIRGCTNRRKFCDECLIKKRIVSSKKWNTAHPKPKSTRIPRPPRRPRIPSPPPPLWVDGKYIRDPKIRFTEDEKSMIKASRWMIRERLDNPD